MSFKMNVIQNKLESYRPFGIIGLPKIGKNQFVRDLIIKYTGSAQGGVTISCGNENGYKHLDNLQYEVAPVWNKEYGKYEENLPEELKTRGLIQIIDELIETKSTNGIKIVALDTIDELYSIAWGQVKEEHRKLKGEYPKSQNDALGGYGAARKRIVELVNQQLDRLSNAGYAVFWIGHTKTKTKEDIISGISYDIITNNLEDNFFTSIEARSQMVMNFVAETEFKDISSETSKGFDGKTKTKEVGTVDNVIRYIYFRDSGLVHASCNFANVPTKIELSVDNFLKVFNDGISAERQKFNNNISAEKIKEQEKEEEKLNNFRAQAVLNKEDNSDSEEKDVLVITIKNEMKGKMDKKEQILSKASELNVNLKDYSTIKLSTLKDFYKFIKEL